MPGKNRVGKRSRIPLYVSEDLRLRQASAEARALLAEASTELRAILEDEYLMEATPIEVWSPLESAVEAIGTALRRLDDAARVKASRGTPSADAPTPRQGQFLAYIRAYMESNRFGVAPTHADLQKFFNLTAPSVNSMLGRLEQREFIRRTPGVARGIELCIDAERIPPLGQPFKL